MATTEAEVNQAHREKMARIKAVKDRIYASKTIEKGLLIVHTGTGKGKSTAAWGLAMRCLGHGLKLGVVQFVKGRRDTGERHLLERFPEQVDAQGDGRRLHLGDPGPRARHRRRTRGLGRGQGDAPGPRAAHGDPGRAEHRAAQGLSAARRGDRGLARQAARPARRGHRPQRQARADRSRRPGHRDDPGQAPVPRRA